MKYYFILKSTFCWIGTIRGSRFAFVFSRRFWRISGNESYPIPYRTRFQIKKDRMTRKSFASSGRSCFHRIPDILPWFSLFATDFFDS